MTNVVGNTLRSRRNKLNYTLRQLENLTGISNSYLCQVENGKRGLSCETLAILTLALAFRPRELWDVFYRNDFRRTKKYKNYYFTVEKKVLAK